MAGWRDTSWFADTDDPSVPLTANATVTEYDKKNSQTLRLPLGATKTRSRTIITREWIGLTQAAMISVVDCMAHDTNHDVNTEYKGVKTHDLLNVWKIVQNVDSQSNWE